MRRRCGLIEDSSIISILIYPLTYQNILHLGPRLKYLGINKASVTEQKKRQKKEVAVEKKREKEREREREREHKQKEMAQVKAKAQAKMEEESNAMEVDGASATDDNDDRMSGSGDVSAVESDRRKTQEVHRFILVSLHTDLAFGQVTLTYKVPCSLCISLKNRFCQGKDSYACYACQEKHAKRCEKGSK